MSRVFGTPANRALLNLHFLQRSVRKDTGVGQSDAVTRPVKQVAIAGAGTMGQEIAIANLRRQLNVTLTDIDAQTLSFAKTSIFNTGECFGQLKTCSDLPELANCQLVIETIIENQQAKQSYYESIEPAMSDDAVLVSNTSTIPITKLAERLARPNQFCGMHFFHPVAERPLLEIIRGQDTDDETVATAFQYGKQLGKVPIVVADSPRIRGQPLVISVRE